MMKKETYETPMLVAAGSFRKTTGFLKRNGNDRLIFSKNSGGRRKGLLGL